MKLGFVINPIAGIGGAVALKGSDGEAIVEQALIRGAKPKASVRALQAMQQIQPGHKAITIYTASDTMGEDVLRALNLPCDVLYQADEQSAA